MLDKLTTTLGDLRVRIQRHGETIAPFEARTRTTLIDPLLCVLGWDVADPSKVRIESEVDDSNRRVDYALLGDRGQPILYVEAKKLATKKHALEQTAAYVIAQNDRYNTNIRYCVWTNGDSWLAWDIQNQARGRMIDARVSNEQTAKTALSMVGLWRESLVDGSFESPTTLDLRGDGDGETNDHVLDTQETDREGRRPPTKLTDSARNDLIADIATGKLTQVELAKRYGISRGGVAYYVKRVKAGLA